MAMGGKPMKGASKEGKSKRKRGKADGVLDKVRRMEASDQLKRLAMETKAALKEQLRVEKEKSRINRLNIRTKWRGTLRNMKVESLRKQIEILSQSHERDVDRKDAIIQMLDRDLEEAEEQYQMALRSHLLNVDTLIELQDSRLLALEREFEGELRSLEEEFRVEREEIVKQHAREKTELLDIMSAVEVEEAEREAEAKQEHEQNREELRNKNIEEINILRLTLDSTIEELERHFESAHLNYLQNTDQRTQDFKKLTTQDEELSEEIDDNVVLIEVLSTKLAHWRSKISQNTKECDERNRALREEKESIMAHFQELKSRMNRFRSQQQRRLLELTVNARKASKSLKDKLALAERILKLSELARKKETEREKVLPFLSSSIEADIRKEMEGELGDEADMKRVDAAAAVAGGSTAAAGDAAALSAAGEPAPLVSDLGGAGSLPYQSGALTTEGAAVREWDYLELFHRKYNRAVLEKLTVERQRDRLARENAELQAILQQYLDGTSVPADIMDSENPLLVINGKLSFTRAPVARVHPPAAVEAAHVVASYAKATR